MYSNGTWTRVVYIQSPQREPVEHRVINAYQYKNQVRESRPITILAHVHMSVERIMRSSSIETCLEMSPLPRHSKTWNILNVFGGEGVGGEQL